MQPDEPVALIAGGANGIGLATATVLARGGARVVIADRDAAAVEAATAALTSESADPPMGVTLDVSDAAAVNSAVADILAARGRIDILVNSAGIAGRSMPTWDIDDDEWHRVLAVNLSGTFHLIRAVVPAMRAQGYGRIVNVASIAGKEGNPNASPYSASKAGVIALTKSVAKEVARDGVIVNCVTPAVIMTAMNEQVSAEHLEYMLSRIPIGRAGATAEVAELVRWLCSPECSFSTGAVFDISGGRATY
ncbi:SDR family NAD(P)-dependent oxidoreductase [Jiangella asiatica]|uniref:SDR family oxidoreductase n=1 Tax=Jiangella asiatica TaxID=2530372 RepID=A0A4R5DRP5_9ACTN|nr:SDR family NAD(P)-dependent oxidoreductase [Jiangella asiatica]TDE14984.1 SDR family oxidoreductase [Jiangella asiatica]